jgi:lipopolysaccharide biosynthesis protein
MKLVAISRVKNEADIIEAFVRHHVQHFDTLIILDDGSTDATYGILQSLLAEGMPLRLLREASVGFEQNRYMTRLLHMAVDEFGADWVAPLDADEFIEPEEEKTLAQVLHGRERELFALSWSNFVWRPEDDQNSEVNPVTRLRWRISAQRDVHRHLNKVLVPANLLANGRTDLSQGSHHLFQNGCAFPTKHLDAVSLCHFPIRSVAQYASKVAVKYLQYSATANWMGDTGFHNIEPFRLLAEGVDQLQSHMVAYSRRYSLEDTQPPCEEPQEAPLHYMGGRLKYTATRDTPLSNILHCAEAIALQSADFQRQNEALQHALEAAKSEGDLPRTEFLQQCAESEHLRAELSRLSAVHDETLATISWRITEPLRWIRRRFPAAAQFGRAMLRIAWRSGIFELVHRLRDLRAQRRRRDLIVSSHLCSIEKGTHHALANARLDGQPLDKHESVFDPRALPRDAKDPFREMLSKSLRSYRSPDHRSEISAFDFDPSQASVKLFAFYLPQFHPIPENDLWWGKGFTEWTNVTRALPQFDGHDQPRHPADLGFYDLRNEAILEQQVALAKKYGIEGFCFHFYWFAGKRLLEKPLDTFLNRPDLTFKFCLCWANENWTRRWDGQEQEVLIGQQHSSDDDIQVMLEMCKYIDDPRYLTVGDRPVVIVYQVQLLPTPKETAKRWRRVVKERLGKDVLLVYAMTFGNTSDPSKFGFDAAVQFPPHCIEHADITPNVTLWNPQFSGRVLNYDKLMHDNRLRTFQFPVFPTVFPGWDNTPRRSSSGSVFAGSTPRSYAAWLSEAALFATDKPVHGDSIAFINAWNEWGEGAFLEPDQRYGHAFLRATAEVLRPYCALTRAPLELRQTRGATADQRILSKPAIIIHAFYPEILAEILGNIPDTEKQALYVSVPEGHERQFEDIMIRYAPSANLFPMPNRGRDIQPFLALLRHAREQGHSAFIKLHTKSTRHRADGVQWRSTLTEPLFRLCQHGALETVLREHSQLGLATARGQVLDGMSYMGEAGNIAWLRRLCALANITGVPDQFVFAGGSMFAGRIEALHQLLCPEISNLAFEEEQGRVDGTLAHAYERFFGILTQANSFEVAGIEVLDDGRLSVSYNEKCTQGYQFAQRLRF